MTFIEKVSNKEIYDFIVKFNREYHVNPGKGFMAGIFRVTPKTIGIKLDELEARGAIKRQKKNKNIVSYELVDGFMWSE